MWIRQQICGPDINYDLWKEQKATLQKWAALTSGNLFAVDVYAQNYSFASDHFSDLFGYKLSQLRTIEKQGDLLEDKIHPEDHDRMIAMQIKHSEFIYSLPLENRNDFQSIYCFRMQHVHGNYIHVTSRQQVLLTDRNKKAWIILGSMEISPDQTPDKNFRYSFIHRKTGKVFSPDCLLKTDKKLTNREEEILSLIRQGLLSKEIADRLHISIHTVHNHRKNILTRLGVNNSIEAIRQVEKNKNR
ncbi:MAG: LuxR C-terminal-related transcriptional regulator [Tannerellaceae bacterium]|nr:LuxR C-terminal-related transcriptional regulator [Tannerellaceae bacterium]